MNLGGVFLAVLSGAFNGLFTTPMRLQTRWKWENTWLLFIVVACLIMPFAIVLASVPQWTVLLTRAPASALYSALGFGFAWGFGAICFGQSVEGRQSGSRRQNAIGIGDDRIGNCWLENFWEIESNTSEVRIFTSTLPW